MELSKGLQRIAADAAKNEELKAKLETILSSGAVPAEVVKAVKALGYDITEQDVSAGAVPLSLDKLEGVAGGLSLEGDPLSLGGDLLLSSPLGVLLRGFNQKASGETGPSHKTGFVPIRMDGGTADDQDGGGILPKDRLFNL